MTAWSLDGCGIDRGRHITQACIDILIYLDSFLSTSSAMCGALHERLIVVFEIDCNKDYIARIASH